MLAMVVTFGVSDRFVMPGHINTYTMRAMIPATKGGSKIHPKRFPPRGVSWFDMAFSSRFSNQYLSLSESERQQHCLRLTQQSGTLPGALSSGSTWRSGGVSAAQSLLAFCLLLSPREDAVDD